MDEKVKWIKLTRYQISIKMKEFGIHVSRNVVRNTKAIESYDHDYNHLASGSIVSHGIYDLKRNEALINIGLNHETADSICDSILAWWKKAGKIHYSNTTEILILCDSGGANSYRHNVFKIGLQNLTNVIGLPIRICHYPPYASKWNPI